MLGAMAMHTPDSPLRLATERPAQLIVFSDDWGRHPSSCQHLVRQLLFQNRLCCHGGCADCRDYSVLWVNTIGTRRPGLNLADLGNRSQFEYGRLRDLYSGEAPNLFNDQLVIPPHRFYWLTDQG